MAVILFISFRFNEASSSDWPPERNIIPGTAGHTDLARVLTVNQAISWEVFLGPSAPGVVMLGFNKRPSKRQLCKMSCLMHSEKTLSEAAAHSSIV